MDIKGRAKKAYLRNRPQWFAVVCDSTPREQIRANELLQERGYTTLNPVIKEWRMANKFDRARRRKRGRKRCLFPGYIFLQSELNGLGQLMLVDKPLAVWGVLGVNGHPFPIPGMHVEMLRGNDEAPAETRHMQTGYEFGEGDEVVAGGSLAGAEVKVIDVEDERSKVGFKMLGKEFEMHVDTWDLKKMTEGG